MTAPYSTVLSIVGPTAVGKTEVALTFAQRYVTEGGQGVDIISADSRQVYKGMEVVTGSDVPAEFTLHSNDNLKYPYFARGQVFIHGQSIIFPNEEWSVAHFQELAQEVMVQSVDKGRLVILVGGTGLYHHHVFNAQPQLKIPPNLSLRQELEGLELVELQQKLQHLDIERWQSMNHSDQNNPRRLIRAIEILLTQAKENLTVDMTANTHEVNPLLATLAEKHLYLGITDTPENITQKIEARIQHRFPAAQLEVELLSARYEDWGLPAFTATGLKELRLFSEGGITKEQCLEKWTQREVSYAKRQITWWKKQPGITWCSRSDQSWQANLDFFIGRLITKHHSHTP